MKRSSKLEPNLRTSHQHILLAVVHQIITKFFFFFLDQVRGFIADKKIYLVYTSDIPGRRETYKIWFSPEGTQFHTNRNCTDAPKDNKRPKTIPQLRKAYFHSFKSSLIPLFSNNPRQSKRSNIPSLVPSSPSSTLPVEHQLLGTTQETPNHLTISNKVFKTPKNIYKRGCLLS